eukprot:scaffold2310_cov164-Amphora_coffeaeformis.AAC.2
MKSIQGEINVVSQARPAGTTQVTTSPRQLTAFTTVQRSWINWDETAWYGSNTPGLNKTLSF